MIDEIQFEQDGYAITPPLLQAEEIAALISLIERAAIYDQKRGGVRDVMHRVPELHAVSQNSNVRAIVDSILGPESFDVQLRSSIRPTLRIGRSRGPKTLRLR